MEGQITLLEILHPELYEPLPCESCGYDEIGGCGYPCTPDDYCVLGDKWIEKTNLLGK